MKIDAIYKKAYELYPLIKHYTDMGDEDLNGPEREAFVQGVLCMEQQIIDKACKWWGNEFKTHEMQYEDSKSWYNDKVERFKQAMKGE